MVTRAIHAAAHRLAGPVSAQRLERPRKLDGDSIRFRLFHHRMKHWRARAFRQAACRGGVPSSSPMSPERARWSPTRSNSRRPDAVRLRNGAPARRLVTVKTFQIPPLGLCAGTPAFARHGQC